MVALLFQFLGLSLRALSSSRCLPWGSPGLGKPLPPQGPDVNSGERSKKGLHVPVWPSMRRTSFYFLNPGPSWVVATLLLAWLSGQLSQPSPAAPPPYSSPFSFSPWLPLPLAAFPPPLARLLSDTGYVICRLNHTLPATLCLPASHTDARAAALPRCRWQWLSRGLAELPGCCQACHPWSCFAWPSPWGTPALPPAAAQTLTRLTAGDGGCLVCPPRSPWTYGSS